MRKHHPELSKGKTEDGKDKNPWALAWYMHKKKGAKPHYKEQPDKDSKDPKEPVKKNKYKDEDKKEHCVHKSFKEWLSLHS